MRHGGPSRLSHQSGAAAPIPPQPLHDDLHQPAPAAAAAAAIPSHMETPKKKRRGDNGHDENYKSPLNPKSPLSEWARYLSPLRPPRTVHVHTYHELNPFNSPPPLSFPRGPEVPPLFKPPEDSKAPSPAVAHGRPSLAPSEPAGNPHAGPSDAARAAHRDADGGAATEDGPAPSFQAPSFRIPGQTATPDSRMRVDLEPVAETDDEVESGSGREDEEEGEDGDGNTVRLAPGAAAAAAAAEHGPSPLTAARAAATAAAELAALREARRHSLTTSAGGEAVFSGRSKNIRKRINMDQAPESPDAPLTQPGHDLPNTPGRVGLVSARRAGAAGARAPPGGDASAAPDLLAEDPWSDIKRYPVAQRVGFSGAAARRLSDIPVSTPQVVPVAAAPRPSPQMLTTPALNKEAKKCNCKKSRCLKLYCDCFAAGTFCNGCSCQACQNIESNAAFVTATREQIRARNPSAFQQKITSVGVVLGAPEEDASFHIKGCHCKKSHCLKKYCECFQAGVRCGDSCKCESCHNRGPGPAAGGKGPKGAPATVPKAAAPASVGPSSAGPGLASSQPPPEVPPGIPFIHLPLALPPDLLPPPPPPPHLTLPALQTTV